MKHSTNSAPHPSLASSPGGVPSAARGPGSAATRIRNWLPLALLMLVSACATAPKGGDAVDPLTRAYLDALEPMREENWTRAEKSLLRFAEKHPRKSGPWANLAIVYRKLGRNEDAAAAVDKALALNPKNAAAMNQRGILAREAGDFDAAEAAYRQAIATDPAYPLAWLNLGILFDLYRQQPQEALAHYQRYRELLGEDTDRQVAGWIADLERRLNR